MQISKKLPAADRNNVAIGNELTQILFSNGWRSNIVVLAAAVIAMTIFWAEFTIVFKSIWLFAIGTTSAYRLYLLVSYSSAPNNQQQTTRLNRKYLIATFVIATCWMVLIFNGLRLEFFEQRIFFTLLLVSLIGASVPTLAASLEAIYAYILIPSLPALPLLFLRGGDDVAIGVALLIYILMMLKSGQNLHHSLVTSISLRQKVEKLNDDLELMVEERTQEFEQARNEAEKANKAKSIFLANISHEIRTPLNVVINLSQLALKEEMSSKAKQFITTVYKSGDSLLHIINDILDFSKIESGEFSIDHASFDFHILLKDLHESFRYSAEEKMCSLILTNELQNLHFIGDQLRIRQILSNILSNAIKFTEEGEIRLLAKDEMASSTSCNVMLTVTDTGIGIHDEQKDKLFQPFKQVDDSSTRKHGGSGLGLVISKQLVELMNGTISVTSSPGVGTSFTITLPLEISTKENGVNQNDSSQSELAGEELSAISGKKALIVDDIPANQLIMESVLENINMEVLLADNGEQALQILQKNQVDIVFMDIQMPIMDGYQATTLLREELTFETLPIIAMTANALPEDIKKCTESGMDNCLIKPLTTQSIYEIIRKYLI